MTFSQYINVPDGQYKATGYKNDPSSTTDGGPWAHGPRGLFSYPGMQPRIFSAIILPQMGLMDVLPVMPPGYSADSDTGGRAVDDPIYAIITGVTEGDSESLANQRETPCATAPEGGLLKICRQISPYGRFATKTRVTDVREIFRSVNRGEQFDLSVVNQPRMPANFMSPGGEASGNGQWVHNEVNKRLYEMAVSYRRYLAPRIYTGDPTNNTAGAGYREFVGLDTILTAGNKVDAITGSICTAANPYILDFENNIVNDATVGSADIAEYVDAVYDQITHQAYYNGFDITQINLVMLMRPEVFDEVVKIWPVREYHEALVQIGAFANGRVSISGEATIRLRNEMRNGKFLPIRGRPIPVITDLAIARESGTDGGWGTDTQASSDIYMVPISAAGIPITYWEAVRYNTGEIPGLVNRGALRFWESDGGIHLWSLNEKNGCFELTTEFEPRLICRAPYLAGRIQNVGVDRLFPGYRTYDPNSDYFVDGGVTDNGTETTFYTDYSPTTPVKVPSGPR